MLYAGDESKLTGLANTTTRYLAMENRWCFRQSPEEYPCPCGRTFHQDSALTKHQRTCSKTKKRLSSALEKAKEVWKGAKRRRTSSAMREVSEEAVPSLPLPGLLPIVAPLVADATESSVEVRVSQICTGKTC